MNPPSSQADRSDALGGVAPALSVVIVNYNSWPDVVRLVSGLSAAGEVGEGRCEILVVDNASEVPVPAVFHDPGPGVRLIPRPRNGGFAAGVNSAWRVARSPWLLLLNPDVLAGPDLIGQVLGRLAHFEARPGGPPGVVGFGLRNGDGSRQPSVGADPSLWRSLRGLFIPRPRRKYQAASRTRPGPVAWVTGACALVDASLLGDLGGMDEEFFLYYEEVALCRSARDRGRSVEYDPSLEVVHLRPLQNRPITPKLRVITRHSKLLYYRKYLPRWQFATLCRVVAVEALGRGGWAGLRGREAESRAWRAIGRLAGEVFRGGSIVGRSVLEIAEAAVGTAGDVRAEPGHDGPGRRRRHRRRRKLGRGAAIGSD